MKILDTKSSGFRGTHNNKSYITIVNEIVNCSSVQVFYNIYFTNYNFQFNLIFFFLSHIGPSKRAAGWRITKRLLSMIRQGWATQRTDVRKVKRRKGRGRDSRPRRVGPARLQELASPHRVRGEAPGTLVGTRAGTSSPAKRRVCELWAGQREATRRQRSVSSLLC